MERNSSTEQNLLAAKLSLLRWCIPWKCWELVGIEPFAEHDEGDGITQTSSESVATVCVVPLVRAHTLSTETLAESFPCWHV